MPTNASLAQDAHRGAERIDREPRQYADSHELDGWVVIADGTNYRRVKSVTIDWLEARGLDPEQAEHLDLRLDFLAGIDDSPTIRTRLRSELLDRHVSRTGQG